MPPSQDSLAWLGSQQLPHSPSPGPWATLAKPPLGSHCLDATQMPKHPNTAFRAWDPPGWHRSHRAEGSRARSWLYLSRAAGSPRRAARWLCPQPLPPPPPAASRSPGRCGPPPSSRPRPRALGPASPRWFFTASSKLASGVSFELLWAAATRLLCCLQSLPLLMPQGKTSQICQVSNPRPNKREHCN